MVQQMLQQGQQGAQMARQGAVLNAYRNTMGFCAPDEQLVFFKRGGRICKTCQKKVVEAKRGAKAKAKFFKNGKRLNKNC